MPTASATEAAVVEDIDVIPVSSLGEAVRFVAGDLQIAWMLFDRPARGEFLAAYGAEAHLGLAGRARAWAVHSAFVYLDNDEGDPLMTRMGVTTLRRLLD